MKQYGLCLKNSNEFITKINARGAEEALQKFSHKKQLEPYELLELFRIVEIPQKKKK